MMPLSRMPKTTKGRPLAVETAASWRHEGGSSDTAANFCNRRW